MRKKDSLKKGTFSKPRGSKTWERNCQTDVQPRGEKRAFNWGSKETAIPIGPNRWKKKEDKAVSVNWGGVIGGGPGRKKRDNNASHVTISKRPARKAEKEGRKVDWKISHRVQRGRKSKGGAIPQNLQKSSIRDKN